VTADSLPPGDELRLPEVLPAGLGYGWPPPAPRPKFRHRYRPHIILFLLTLLTTSLAGSCSYAGLRAIGLDDPSTVTLEWMDLYGGLITYALPALLILGSHEFGHYFYCRKYDVDATLPYFLPAPPLFLFGTFGAVIRIKEPFPSKRSLFDIGIAGPIAGFIVLLPFLYLGLSWSEVTTVGNSEDIIYFGEPVLLKFLAWLRFGTLPEGSDIMLHPVGFAAWFGMLATALNLLPFGQLDGGHISYAVFGRHAESVSLATLGLAVVLTIYSTSWLFLTGLMLLMAYFFGFRHPPVIDEPVPLDGRRKALAAFALVMFLLCFTPTPLTLGGSDDGPDRASRDASVRVVPE